jgi:predicted nucleotidyltransferase
MNFNVTENTILLVKHGSHAYGLNTPESDLDVKGSASSPLSTTSGSCTASSNISGRLRRATSMI